MILAGIGIWLLCSFLAVLLFSRISRYNKRGDPPPSG